MLRLAHRGDWRLARENSLEALVFAAGMEGVDGVEFDVRLAKDGVPVLLHDETLERVQGRDAAVGDLTAAELREDGIPTLELVLATLPAEAFLDVELKGPGHGAATADVLRAGRGKAPPARGRLLVRRGGPDGDGTAAARLAALAQLARSRQRHHRDGDPARVSGGRRPVEGDHARRRSRPPGRRVSRSRRGR